MPRLTRALEILSETEKQLQTTKNKSTWLTAALLQFNTEESFPLRDSCDSCAGMGYFTLSGSTFLNFILPRNMNTV